MRKADFLKPKASDVSLRMGTFRGKSGNHYLVLKGYRGSYHVFAEVEAKIAAKDCGATGQANTRALCKKAFGF